MGTWHHVYWKTQRVDKGALALRGTAWVALPARTPKATATHLLMKGEAQCGLGPGEPHPAKKRKGGGPGHLGVAEKPPSHLRHQADLGTAATPTPG